MFEIKFYVDDAKLGEAFKRLAGLARDLEHKYVVNLEPAKGPKAKGANGKTNVSAADASDLILKELTKRKLDSFPAPLIKTILNDLGMAASSYSHRLANMVEAGVLKKGKKDGMTVTYHVVK